MVTGTLTATHTHTFTVRVTLAVDLALGAVALYCGRWERTGLLPMPMPLNVCVCVAVNVAVNLPVVYVIPPSFFSHNRNADVFPLRDDNPTVLTPWVTVALILANIGVWVYVQGMGFDMAELADSVCRLGAIPAEVTGRTGGYEGVSLGEGLPPCAFGGLTHEAVLTSMFLHGSWLHLIANMWFLWLFGNNIEDSTGHGRFLVFYLLAGVAATGAHIFMAPDSPVPVVGASGAISGVMGAYLLLYPRIRVETLFIFIVFFRIIPVPAWFVLILWFGLQVLSGYLDPVGTSGVAVWAHVGGFVAGVLLIKIFENRSLVAARERARLSGAGK